MRKYISLIVFIFIAVMFVLMATYITVNAQSTIQSLMARSGSRDLIIVRFDMVKQELELSSKVDFADVKVTFDDFPNQSITMKALRDWIKVQPELKPRPIPVKD